MQNGMPATVRVLWCHNHGLATAAALYYRPADSVLKSQFFEYFSDGMNPAGA